MTGTTSLSAQQVKALATIVDETPAIRLIVHPITVGHARDIRVEVRTLDSGDILTSTRYILDTGRILTTQEYETLLNR